MSSTRQTTVCLEVVEVLAMLMSEDKNDVLCMLNQIKELSVNGLAKWNPVPSYVRELEQESTLTEESSDEDKEEGANTDGSQAKPHDGDGQHGEVDDYSQENKSIEDADDVADNEGENINGGHKKQGLAKAQKKMVKRLKYCEGGDEEAIRRLRAFLAHFEAAGQQFRTSDDSLLLLVHHCSMLAVLKELLENMMQDFEQRDSRLQADFHVLFLGEYLWLLRPILFMLKHCARVRSLKPLLASPELGLIPILSDMLSHFANDLDDNIVSDLLAVMENLCKFVALAPVTSRAVGSTHDTGAYLSNYDGESVIKALLRICSDYARFDLDMQSRAFSCLSSLAERSRENGRWLVTRAKMEAEKHVKVHSLAKKYYSAPNKLVSLSRARNVETADAVAAPAIDQHNVLYTLHGVLVNFINGKLVRSQAATVHYTFDVLNALISHQDDDICIALYNSPVRTPLLHLISSDPTSELASRSIVVVSRLCSKSLSVQKAMIHDREKIVEVMIYQLRKGSFGSKVNALKLLVTLSCSGDPQDPLMLLRVDLVTHLLLASVGLLGEVKHILLVSCQPAAPAGGSPGGGRPGVKASEYNSGEITTLCLRLLTGMATSKLAELARAYKEKGSSPHSILDVFDHTGTSQLQDGDTPILIVLDRLLQHPSFLQRTSCSIFDSPEELYDHDVSQSIAAASAVTTFAGVSVSLNDTHCNVIPAERCLGAARDAVPDMVVQALAFVAVLVQDVYHRDTIRQLWSWRALPRILSYLRINSPEVMDAGCPESMAEQCIVLILCTVLTAGYDGNNSTFPSVGAKDSPAERYSEAKDMHEIIVRDVRKMQLEYQIARKIIRGGAHVNITDSPNLRAHPQHTKLTLCLLILVGGRPSLPDGEFPRALLKAANSHHRQEHPATSTETATHDASNGDGAKTEAMGKDSSHLGDAEKHANGLHRTEDAWRYSSIRNLFEELLHHDRHTRRGKTAHGKHTTGSGHAVEDGYYEQECYQLLSDLLSNWYGAEVLYAKQGGFSGSAFSGVVVQPRSPTLFSGGALGLPAFGVTILDNSLSVIAVSKLENGAASSSCGEEESMSIYSNISFVEMENAGLDLPLEAVLLALKELAVGAAMDGYSGGYFPTEAELSEVDVGEVDAAASGSSGSHSPSQSSRKTAAATATAAVSKKPLPSSQPKTCFAYNNAQQFLCTSRLIKLIISVLCECFDRSKYKDFSQLYARDFRAGPAARGGAADGASSGDFSGKNGGKKAPTHFHRSHRPSLLIQSESRREKEAEANHLAEQRCYRRCMSLCVQTLLHLSYLYEGASPFRLMVDWFPQQRDVSEGFLKLLETLTSVVNCHKMMALAFKRCVAHPNRRPDLSKFVYNIDECNHLSRMCKALYRALREAKADKTYVSSVQLFTSQRVMQRMLLGDKKLHTMGKLDPLYVPSSIAGAAATEARKHVVFSYYCHGYHSGRSASAGLQGGHAQTVEALAAQLKTDMKNEAEVWTYFRGSPFAANMANAEAEFYTEVNEEIDDDDKSPAATAAVSQDLPRISLLDSSCMNRDAVLDAMDTAELIVVFVSQEYRDCPLCRLECTRAIALARAEHARVVFVILESTFSPANSKTKADRNIEWAKKRDKEMAGSTAAVKYAVVATTDTLSETAVPEHRRTSIMVKKHFKAIAAASKLLEISEEEREREEKAVLTGHSEAWRHTPNPEIPHTIPLPVSGWIRRVLGGQMWFACWDIRPKGQKSHVDYLTSWLSVCERVDFNSNFIIPESYYRPKPA